MINFEYIFNQRHVHFYQHEVNTDIGLLKIHKNRVSITYKNPQLRFCFDKIKYFFNFQYKYIILIKPANRLTSICTESIDLSESKDIFFINSSMVCAYLLVLLSFSLIYIY